MKLTIPYEHSSMELTTYHNGDLVLTFSKSPEFAKVLFNQLLYDMSYDEVIDTITPQSFEQIVLHYQTNYKED